MEWQGELSYSARLHAQRIRIVHREARMRALWSVPFRLLEGQCCAAADFRRIPR